MVRIPIHPLTIEIKKNNQIKSTYLVWGHDGGHDEGHDDELTENMLKILSLLKNSPLSAA